MSIRWFFEYVRPLIVSAFSFEVERPEGDGLKEVEGKAAETAAMETGTEKFLGSRGGGAVVIVAFWEVTLGKRKGEIGKKEISCLKDFILRLSKQLFVMGNIEEAIQAACYSLRIPTYFYSEGYETDPDLLIKAKIFQTEAKLTFLSMKSLLKNFVEEHVQNETRKKLLDDEILQLLIFSCGAFIAFDGVRLDLELKRFANDILHTLTLLQPKRFPSLSRLVQIYTLKILERFVRPCFVRYFGSTGVKKGQTPSPSASSGRFFHFIENEEELRLQVLQAASILQWCILNAKNPELEPMIGLVVPSILCLIDDYNIKFKIYGVSILDHLLKEVNSTVMQRMGLGKVFYQTLLACLTYRSEESHLNLLKTSFSAMIKLIPLVDPSNDKEIHTRFEKVLDEHVIKGLIFAGDKISIRKVLLDQLPILTDILGIVIVKYLQELTKILCATLEVPIDFPNNAEILELQITSATAFQKIISTCWPRIPRYEGAILKSVATSWCRVRALELNDISTDTSTTLKEKLRDICRVLKLACNESQILKNDFEALRSLDTPVFYPLLEGL
ncbi:hypothetical protein G9A89_014789 [Geosiphon pyriformis]|nr:hypothetical protein G9A89_014789 [Geosiphon pyriformis]